MVTALSLLSSSRPLTARVTCSRDRRQRTVEVENFKEEARVKGLALPEGLQEAIDSGGTGGPEENPAAVHKISDGLDGYEEQ